MKKKKFGIETAVELLPVIILVAVAGYFIIATKGLMLAPLNLITFVQRVAVLLICASGMNLIISQGGIDMSAGGVAGVAGTVAALMSAKYGFWILFPAAIIIGGAIGLVEGLIVTKAKVSSFLTTLCMSTILRAAMNMILANDSYIASSQVKALAKLYILLPILAVICIAIFLLFERSPVGYNMRAIGENEVAARFAGVSPEKNKILAFTIAGVCSAIAGVLTISRLGSAANTTGTMMELQSMIAIFLGGVLVVGGRSARYHKVILGCITYMALDNGMSILRVNSLLNQSIRGLVLILIVAITMFCNKLVNKKSGNKVKITL